MYSPPYDLSSSEVYNFLSSQTGLEFQQLSDQFVAIVKPQNPATVFCGFISDSESGEPLVGATVSTDRISDVSNELGYFLLDEVDPGEVITISFLGYEPYYLTPNDFSEKCLSFALKPNISTLSEVIIENYVARGINRSADGTLSIQPKNQQMVPGMTEPDVLFTIQSLPGIQSVDESVSNLNIRGGTHDQNLILWEGIRMYQSGHFFGLISAFNPHFNDEINITKNGTSASFGNGVSGTIDMRSDDRNFDKISGSVGAGLNMINGDINLRIPISDKTSFKISSRRAITDVIRTPTYDKYFERAFENTDVIRTNPLDTIINTDDNFYFYDVSSRITHRISDKEKLSVSFLNIFNKLDFTESETTPGSQNDKTSELQQKSLAVGGAYHRKMGSKSTGTISAEGYFSKYNLDAINFDIPNDQRLVQENEVLDTDVKLSARFDTSFGQLVAGYEFNETGVKSLDEINNPDFSRLRKQVLQTHAVFVENSLQLDQTKLRIGLRGNYYQQVDRYLPEPRIAISHEVTPAWSVEILGEFKSQAVVQVIDLQNDFLGVEKRRWVLSNEADVPIVTSKNISVGAHYQKNHFLVSLEAYARKAEGIITSSQGFQNQYELIRSSGSATIYGAEILVSAKINHISTWISCSHSRNNNSFPALRLDDFPGNFDLRNVVTSGIRYEKDGLEISSGLSMRSGVPYTATELINGTISFSEPNNSRLANYFRLDFSASYLFRLSGQLRGKFGVSFWNLTNNKNLLSRFFRESGNQLEAVDQRALAFTPNVMFRVYF